MPRTSRDALIIVFAKAPRAGEVKTRLIPLLGADGAASLHRHLVHRTLATATRASLGAVELHCAPDDHDAFLRDEAQRFGIAARPQRGRDLGERLHHAFEDALARHSNVLVIGCDCPMLTEDHLRDAGTALADGNDAVLIPAEDGGYVLIGLRQCDARLFDAVTWGSETVLAETRSRLKGLGWRWRELDPLWDIDRPDDYRRWSELVVSDENQPLA